ncbi:unnamed protein product [Effrenium voratum]|nr:unnamed protein product [Effrenium voratum]
MGIVVVVEVVAVMVGVVQVTLLNKARALAGELREALAAEERRRQELEEARQLQKGLESKLSQLGP